jgi:hypothetical protein
VRQHDKWDPTDKWNYLTNGTSFRKNWIKIKKKCCKKDKAWNRKRPDIGLSPFS